MGHLKKLLFTKKFTDYGEYKWAFSYNKAMAWSVSFLVLFILIYGFFIAKDTHEFFGKVLFVAILISIAVFLILLAVGSIKKSKKFIGKFFLLIVGIIFAYYVIGLIFSQYLWGFYSGYSTWFLIVALAGYGASRDYIFNGNLDRHDVFYCLLIFICFVGANIPFYHNKSFLENMDGIINMIKDIMHINFSQIGNFSR